MLNGQIRQDNEGYSHPTINEIEHIRRIDREWLAKITRIVGPRWLKEHDAPYWASFGKKYDEKEI